jgi:surface protein
MRIAFLVVLAIVAVLASACTTTTTANTDCTALVDSNIQTAVDAWVSDQVAAEVTYGHISDWFTGDVTSMAQLFWNKASFNEDITGWDTSSVTTMLYMFMGASAFNQAIGAWDVSRVSVTDAMDYMFFNANAFSQDLSAWCVENLPEPGNFGNAGGTNPAWSEACGTLCTTAADGHECQNSGNATGLVPSGSSATDTCSCTCAGEATSERASCYTSERAVTGTRASERAGASE